jgi:hypothetical protein
VTGSLTMIGVGVVRYRRWRVAIKYKQATKIIQLVVSSIQLVTSNYTATSTLSGRGVTRRKETKTNVHLMQQTSCISSMDPRTMLDMLVQKEMGVLAAVNNAMQSEESLCHTSIIGPPSLSSWANSISDTVTTINVATSSTNLINL